MAWVVRWSADGVANEHRLPDHDRALSLAERVSAKHPTIPVEVVRA